MEPDRSNQPGPGQYGCDRDTFLRVWRRVMPRETPACPITVETGAQVAQFSRAGQQRHAPAGAAPQDSTMYAADLQQFISGSLKAWKEYQTLVRQAPGGAGRLLNVLAGEKLRHAKRLSAALFLITGVRYWPAGRVRSYTPAPYRGALRERYLAEGRMQQAYRAAAQGCQDSSLRELYLELADECADHAQSIRSLLETL